MTTHRDAPTAARGGTTAGTTQWLAVAAVILGFTVIALGAWVIYDQDETPPVPAAIAAVIADYNAAMNTADTARAEAVLTADYRYSVNEGGSLPLEDQMARFAFLDLSGYETEPLSDLIVSGVGPYYGTELRRITAPGLLAEPVDVIMVYTVVEDGGVWKVSRHLVLGDY